MKFGILSLFAGDLPYDNKDGKMSNQFVIDNQNPRSALYYEYYGSETWYLGFSLWLMTNQCKIRIEDGEIPDT